LAPFNLAETKFLYLFVGFSAYVFRILKYHNLSLYSLS